MKKIILLLLFIASLLSAESKVYLGTGYAYSSETITYNEDERVINNNIARIKIGYGNRKAYAVELSFDYTDNNSRIFDPNDGKKYGFNIELLKAWDFGIAEDRLAELKDELLKAGDLGIYINPYVKAGFGGGYLETPVGIHNNSLSYGSFNLGAGLFIPINKHFDLELAYEYRYISYQKFDLSSALTPSSHLNIGYVGINFRF